MLLKHLIILIALTTGFAPAWATTARITALGGGDFMEDDHNVLRWYGSLGDYPDQVSLESGHFNLPDGWHDGLGRLTSGPALGAHLKLGGQHDWGTLAVYANAQGHDIDSGGLAADRMPTTGTVIWARRFGRMQPALTVRSSRDSGSQEGVPTLGWERSRTEYGAGLRWDLNAGAYLDLAGEIRRHSEQTSASTGPQTTAGDRRTSSGSFGLRARMFVRLNPTLALVPVVSYVHEGRPLSAPTPAVDTDLRGDLVMVGTGLNWYPDPDHLLIASLDYVSARSDHLAGVSGSVLTVENSRRWDSLSLTMGFESRFRYWLTFRGSVRYQPVNLTETALGEPGDFAALMMNLGAAFQLGPYDLDLAVAEREPQAVVGDYGHTAAEAPTTWLSATFRRTF